MSDFDFDKEVATAHFENAGWGLDQFNHSNPFECHLFYIRDYRTGHVQVFTIRKDHLEELIPKDTSLALGGVLGELMMRIHQRTATEKELWMLMPVLGGYFKGTQTFQQWKRLRQPGERAHVLINIYGGDNPVTGVRPFMVRVDGTVLDASVFMEQTDRVKQMDQANHPEWFGR